MCTIRLPIFVVDEDVQGVHYTFDSVLEMIVSEPSFGIDNLKLLQAIRVIAVDFN